MKETEKTFLNLLFTALKDSAFPSVQLSNKVLLSYLDLKSERESLRQSYESEYDGISREKFEKDDPLTSCKNLLSRKIKALQTTVDSISFESLNRKTVPYIQFEEIPDLKHVFDFYCEKTGQVIEKPAKIYALNDETALSIATIVRSIGKDLVKVHILDKISDKLLFDDFYNPRKNKIVQSPAIACSEVYYQLKNGDQFVDSNDLKERVLNNYYFQIYSEDSPEEAIKTAEKVVLEWIRKKKKKSDFLIK